MKNQLVTIFLLLFFLLKVSFASTSIQDGGEEFVIIQGKTGDIVCTFEIPKKYLGEDGLLLLSFNVVVNQNTKQAIYRIQSENTKIYLPRIEGSYTITFSIGDHVLTYKVEE